MDNQAWETHKAGIECPYLEEGQTLKDLKEPLATHGFPKTKNQYETKSKQWGLKKNRGGSQKWKCVTYQLEKRKGKQSELFIDGIEYPTNTVNYGTSRQECQSSIAKLDSAVSLHSISQQDIKM
ncbi:hypothetical protein ASPWEDRAFT_185079 [Aspergillus wentii DTO 134E9]|uniref:Clr5 domain-containing protein n=1 Tax=Aspergillus wentii DTO 134E9 TaxID=1073089 RepID=A0A1L9RIB8_ASPWE|nr:uncharacterized protein ASPWEDRAFT_185079 [Aspergillus wentii DTO 134E9]OJJ34613.1 hypothetical protein ASPWEDRAFT_185079 [Aspergillus wentii DTO 134E9]